MPGQGFSRVVAPSSGWRLPRRGEENLFVTRPMPELGHKRIFGDVCSMSALPPESGHSTSGACGEVMPAAAIDFIVLQHVPVAGTARVGG
jgi:hypothetical protein